MHCLSRERMSCILMFLLGCSIGLCFNACITISLSLSVSLSLSRSHTHAHIHTHTHTYTHAQFHAPDLSNQFKVAHGKGISSLAAEAKEANEEHSDAEIKMAKVKALEELEHHDPAVKTKIAEVHHQWMEAGHKAPPTNAAEEKEYQALMSKIVGHPDTSFQTD